MRSLLQLFRRLRYGAPIIIVSGLPRSGTSMAMRMLEAGGVPILIDHVRGADASNPFGYFELEQVKLLDKHGDLSWLPTARGKAVKIISFLLTWLPDTYDYRVLFMERDLDEVVASQQKMLGGPYQERRVAPARENGTNDETTVDLYAKHLHQVRRFLATRRCFKTLAISYRAVIDDPSVEARRINAFLGGRLDVEGMAAAVESRLYRSRR